MELAVLWPAQPAVGLAAIVLLDVSDAALIRRMAQTDPGGRQARAPVRQPGMHAIVVVKVGWAALSAKLW
jgi:hypothetical protein